MLARKPSSSSVSSGIGMGPAWRSRYARKRTGSIASIVTSNSAISEDLVEEDEEQDLLGVGGGFDGTSVSTASTSTSGQDEPERPGDSAGIPNEGEDGGLDTTHTETPMLLRNRVDSCSQPVSGLNKTKFLSSPPPTAPSHRSSFGLPPLSSYQKSFALPPVPATACRSSFDLPPRYRPSSFSGSRRRPILHGTLPTVPDSPSQSANPEQLSPILGSPILKPRQRRESCKPTLPPIHVRNSSFSVPSRSGSSTSVNALSTNHTSSNTNFPSANPTQTLFIFPPSPTMSTRTPSAMTLTSNAIPFPAISSPRVATIDKRGKRRSFIGIMAPPTPSTAHSRVDARGWVGVH